MGQLDAETLGKGRGRGAKSGLPGIAGALHTASLMPTDLQSIAAAVIVLVTVLAFVWRAVSRGGRQGCGGACGCDLKPRSKPGVKTPGSP
jgi:hypothetical protein